MPDLYNTYTLIIWFSPGTSIGVSSMLFALVLIGRAAFIFPIANISNCFKKRENKKIEFRSQVQLNRNNYLVKHITAPPNLPSVP